ncbi:MAG: hypothetical protein JXR63_09275, partial [Spirochaetales bacterium]|nr:hypothetical protein [Spirochaetales bacterium]
QNKIYAGGADGNITVVDNFSDVISTEMANLQSISSSTYFDMSFFVTSGKTLYIFENSENFTSPKIVELEMMTTPLLYATKDLLFLYDKSSGIVTKYSPAEKSFKKVYKAEGGIEFFKVQNGFIIQYLRSNYIQLVNLSDFSIYFDYRATNIRDAILTNSGNLYLGYNRVGDSNSTILMINTGSGESIQVDTNEQVTYQFAYNPNTDTIYTLGLENVDNQTRTVIKAINSEDWTTPRAIFVADGEDNSARIEIDTENYYLYTNIGDGTIKILKWMGFTPVENISENSLKISLHTNFILSTNGNGSITIFDIFSGKKIAEIYILKDKQWIATIKDNKYKSDQAQDFVINF